MDGQRGTRVYVGNLTDSVKKEDLEDEFNKYGKLNSVWIALNPPGFAFVEFEHRDDAEKACDVLNGTELLGSQLRVNISERRPRQGRGGGERGRYDDYSRGSGGRGSFRPRGSNNGSYYDRNSYGSGGGRYGGGYNARDGNDGGGFNQRDGYGGRGRDGNSRPYGNRGGYGGGGRSGGAGGGRFRSRSPGGSQRF